MTEERDAPDQPVVDDGAEATPDETTDGPDEAALEAFDLDGDGRISVTENARAELGSLTPRRRRWATSRG